MKKQGHADREIDHGSDPTRSYNINQNYPNQLGSCIDPHARERMSGGQAGLGHGPTSGMAEGPGANRSVKAHGGQGSH
jgi:hypothetical protein